MNDRKQNMKVWLNSLGYDLNTLQIASEDASFRRYFRIRKNSQSYIVMDAPPEHESCESFVMLATRLTNHHVNAPMIYNQNMDDGYLVLSDFGDGLLLELLNDETVDGLYAEAMAAIVQMQSEMPQQNIPNYTEVLLNAEMDLFKEWFIEKLLGIQLSKQQQALWQQTKTTLVKSAVEQPQTFVHRDFHSRNLIKTPQNTLGIIDFQDAVKGAMTYDLVSLLRDCYIDWPEKRINEWVSIFYIKAKEANLVDVSLTQFKQWFDLMGVQRHLKAIGIFSRLKLRDDKKGYIADIPRTLRYVEQVCIADAGLQGLGLVLSELDLLPKINLMVEKLKND